MTSITALFIQKQKSLKQLNNLSYLCILLFVISITVPPLNKYNILLARHLDLEEASARPREQQSVTVDGHHTTDASFCTCIHKFKAAIENCASNHHYTIYTKVHFKNEHAAGMILLLALLAQDLLQAHINTLSYRHN